MGEYKSQDEVRPKGCKDDKDKLRYDLMPVDTFRDIVQVLTFGANKYDDNNWQYVDDPCQRYYAALQRHVEAWRAGEALDSESNLPHLAHALCCLIFMSEISAGYNL